MSKVDNKPTIIENEFELANPNPVAGAKTKF
jgi:hypothetical protein